MTCFPIQGYSILPKKELRRSLQAATGPASVEFKVDRLLEKNSSCIYSATPVCLGIPCVALSFPDHAAVGRDQPHIRGP